MSVASRKRARAMWLLAGFGGAAAASPSVPLLLDTYSGAAAAYSLRRLNTAYTGPVVQVRRSGDSAEDTFSADEVGDGTLAAWVTAGGGTEDGFVKTWYDQSGNGNDASQETAGSQPQIVDNGAVLTNGTVPKLEFIEKYMISSVSSNQPTSLFCAFNRSAGNYLCDGSIASSRLALFWTSSEYQLYAGVALNGDAGSGAGNDDLIFALVNSASSNLRTSLGVDFIGNAGTQNLTGLVIGGRYSLDNLLRGSIYELILYASDQSSNRTGIESNIASHYGITLS